MPLYKQRVTLNQIYSLSLGYNYLPEICLELPECWIHLCSAEVDLGREAREDGLVERMADIAQVLSDHLLGQPLPGDQEPGHGGGGVVQEPLVDEVVYPLLRLFVKYIKSGSIVPLPDDFVDCIVTRISVLAPAWNSVLTALIQVPVGSRPEVPV